MAVCEMSIEKMNYIIFIFYFEVALSKSRKREREREREKRKKKENRIDIMTVFVCLRCLFLIA